VALLCLADAKESKKFCLGVEIPVRMCYTACKKDVVEHMKILVVSDSHSALRFMRLALQAIKPDAVVHLGDCYDDAQVIAEENPNLIVHQVPGNCDRFKCPISAQEILCYRVCGVDLYMTHGHLHGVKMGLWRLLQEGASSDAQAILFGHTHKAECFQEGEQWVMNPGSCGNSAGSVGLIETDGNKITACRILRQTDLEGMV